MFTGKNDALQHPDFSFSGETHKYALSAFDSFEKRWTERRFSGNMYSEENNLHDAAEEYIDEIEKTTGKRLDNPYRGAWNSFLVEDVMLGLYDEMVKNPFSAEDRQPDYYERRQKEREKKRVKEFYRELDDLKKEYPDLVYKKPDDLQNEIKAKAEKIRAAADLNQKENAFAGFAGETLAWLSDPGHLSASAFVGFFTGGTGATLTGTVARAAAYEGVTNAGVEAVSQANVMPYKKELGFDYTAADAAENIVAAGVGGAVLGAAVPAVKAGLKGLVGRVNNLKKRGFKLRPAEEDALNVAEHQIVLADEIRENSPFPENSAENMAYERRIEEEQNRLLRPYEEKNLSEAWDKTAAERFGNAHDVLARISREDMKDIVFEQGEWTPKFGNSGSGYGMVKFVWKHGELGNDEIPVMKDDILRFPEIVDSKMPMIDSSYGDTFHWSVRRKDGVQIMYAAKETEYSGGARTMVTIHALNPNAKNKNVWFGVLSPDRKGLSREPVDRLDVLTEMNDEWLKKNNTAGRSQSRLTEDTAQKPYYQHKESSANASAPESRFQGGGDVNEYSITPEEMNVKPDGDFAYPTVQEVEDLLQNEDFMLAGDEIDGALQVKSARETLAEIRKERSGIDEITDCINSYGGKNNG